MRAEALNPVYHFVGTVTDADGRPIAGATVDDGGGEVATTDAKGRYSLGESGTGSFTLDAWRADTGLSTQQVNVLVPVDTTVNFTLLYLASSRLAETYVSTANGPLTDTVTVTSWAPNPGGSQAGNSCVTVTDSRTNSTSPATLQSVNANGTSTWTASVTLPAGSPQGVQSLTAAGVDCSSNTTLTVSAPAQYLIDNTPPTISQIRPTVTNKTSPLVSAQLQDSGGSGLNMAASSISVDGHQLATPSDGGGSSSAITATASDLGTGQHSISVIACDWASNCSTANSTFIVDTTPPTLSAPSPTGTTTSASPLIAIATFDTDTGINGASPTMSISNGLITDSVHPSYNSNSGEITYQVPTVPTGAALGQFPLPDGTYTVTVTVQDNAGNTSTTRWTFTVKTLPI